MIRIKINKNFDHIEKKQRNPYRNKEKAVLLTKMLGPAPRNWTRDVRLVTKVDRQTCRAYAFDLLIAGIEGDVV